MILARWTYTKEEWKAFLRSTRKHNNIFQHLFHFIFLKTARSIPVIQITPERVWIGNDQQRFSNDRYTLKQISIRERDKINILEILYEKNDARGVLSNAISIPVPKGKLKEAIEVEMQLNDHIRGH